MQTNSSANDVNNVLLFRPLSSDSELASKRRHDDCNCKRYIANGVFIFAMMARKKTPSLRPLQTRRRLHPSGKRLQTASSFSPEEFKRIYHKRINNPEKIVHQIESTINILIAEQATTDTPQFKTILQNISQRYGCSWNDIAKDLKQFALEDVTLTLHRFSKNATDDSNVHDIDRQLIRLSDFHARKSVNFRMRQWLETNISTVQSNISTAIGDLQQNGNYHLFDELPWETFNHYRRVCSQSEGRHVHGKLPLLFLGDLVAYLSSDIRIITLSRTPNKNEFMDDIECFKESQMDYQIIMNRPWGNNEYLTLCNNYFKGTSNLSFFNKYTHLLSRWNAGYTALKNDTDTAEKRNIAVHFFFNSPIALNCPWESITEKEQYELSFEEHFKDIFNTLAPHIILCDFDCSKTWLGKAAIDIERLPN